MRSTILKMGCHDEKSWELLLYKTAAIQCVFHTADHLGLMMSAEGWK